MKRKILIADDEPLLLQTLEKHFNWAGYSVYTAIDGRSALEIMLTTQIHFAIIDINMPNINGLELAEIMLNTDTLKKIPFMLLSSESKQELFEKAIDLGAKWVRSKDELKHRDLPSEVSTMIVLEKV
jgi:CheY-like chemotaxis protein